MKNIVFRNMAPCSLISIAISSLPFIVDRFSTVNHFYTHKVAADSTENSACINKILQCRDLKVKNFPILGFWILKTNWNNCLDLITVAF